MLTACASSMPSVAKVELPELPETLKSCPALQSVSSRISDAEMVGDSVWRPIWAQDRAVAASCARKHRETVAFYEALRETLLEPETETSSRSFASK